MSSLKLSRFSVSPAIPFRSPATGKVNPCAAVWRSPSNWRPLRLSSPPTLRPPRAVPEVDGVPAAAYVDSGGGGSGRGVPVYIMLPLDSMTAPQTATRTEAMERSLRALKKAGVEGVMVDVWWGLVEAHSPGDYHWRGYDDLFQMTQRIGLRVQAVMSFHQCGGNVGDTVHIPLPRWVREEMDKDQDIAYTDQWGCRNYEYVSLGCDNIPVLKGRTPVQCYADFMTAFKNKFSHFLGNTIKEIQVGMGPAGELRYPSYPEQNGIWNFPGIGAFQCYDKYMLGRLKSAAEASGKPEWGSTGPTDAGGYNSWPEETTFFKKDGGGWTTTYGEFFLNWYSKSLIDHGDRILASAEPIFAGTGAKISAKIAGVHWHYTTRAHAAELTAGYYNTRFREGYLPIAQMLARHGAVFNFTCVEMSDHEHPEEGRCSPEGLVRQVALACAEAGVALAGENALPRFDARALEQVLRSAREGPMCAFTFLRLSGELFKDGIWERFRSFVRKMRRKGSDMCAEELEEEADHFVYVDFPLPQAEGFI